MTFAEFWPRYLRDHANPTSRALHFAGTGLAIACMVLAGATRDWRWLLAAPVMAYGLAWSGHAFLEKNRPTAFGRPLMSLRADFRMFALWALGRLSAELRKAGIQT